jgi:hypothetical protein
MISPAAVAALHTFLGWLSLPPERPWPGLLLLAGFLVVAELVRVGLATEHTRSVVAHVTMCLLTVAIQAAVLAAVLVHAARSHPGHGWANLGWAAALFGVWYATGMSTRLVRPDSEGADVGFMSVAAVLVAAAGVASAAIW